MLRGSALGSPGSVLELAGPGSAPNGSSSWSHLNRNQSCSCPATKTLLHKPNAFVSSSHQKKPSTYLYIWDYYSGSPYQTKKMSRCSPLMQALLLLLDNSQSGELSPSYPTSPARHIKIPEENKIEKCSQLQNVLISC